MKREAAGTGISAGTSSSKKHPRGAHCSGDTGKAGAALQSPSSLLASQNTHLLTLMLDMFPGACPCSTENGEEDGPLLQRGSAVCWGVHSRVTLTIDRGQNDT